MLVNSRKNIVLIIIYVYLVLGNIPRIIPFGSLKDNLLISEFVVYLVLIIYAAIGRLLIHVIWKLTPVIVIILISFLIGVLINGLEILPLLYAVRLILMLVSSTIAGYLLFRKYRNDIILATKFVVVIYFSQMLLGYTIYFLFPNSASFWSYLRKFGIVFSGDPHIHRFVSSYFDPNYYAAIACLPLILCSFLYSYTRNKIYLLFQILFMISIFLTGSRSGIVTMLAVFLIINYKFIYTTIVRWKIKKADIYMMSSIFALLLVTFPLYYSNVSKMIARLLSIGSDPSALARLKSFQLGLSILNESPIIGLGYNFAAIKTLEIRGLASVDSSLLSTLINFGILPTFIIFLVFCFWAYNTWVKIRKVFPEAFDLFFQVLCYIILIVLFTSQFNNVLYYQFWLFPIVMICTYLTLMKKSGQYE